MDSSHGDRWTAQDDLILRAAERLRRGLQRDDCTGLLGFREGLFIEAIDDLSSDLVEQGVPVSIVLADLDQFRVINDNYGHRAGNEVLGAVGHALREMVRPLDMVMRGEGDGFKLILVGAELDVAVARAELASATLKQLFLRRVPTEVTASFGVACRAEAEPPGALDERAFQALLRAKQLGRNRVEVAPSH